MTAPRHSAPWLSIVGIGDSGLDDLSPAARRLIDTAEVLIGGDRHLAMVPEDGRERFAWPSPLRALVDSIIERRGQRVCVLATGDPMHYGVGVTLAKRLPAEEMTVIPAPSAFSLAAARLGWPLSEVDCLTLHGRPLDLLNAYLQPGAKLMLLSHDGSTPLQVAERLTALGYGPSRMTVLEHMGGPEERRRDAAARDWEEARSADLNTIALDCRAEDGTDLRPRIPGLPDEAFLHDGQLTKREVRAATLARLMPLPGQHLWDVGAGCGSIAIEWMRAAPRATASAVERDARRLDRIAANAAALGTPLLGIVAGEAPDALSGLDAPDAVFLGGGLSVPGLLDTCWTALSPGGRLVANAVTTEGEATLLAFQAAQGGDLVRIQISRVEPVGPYQGWRPLMPVTQYAAIKPWESKT